MSREFRAGRLAAVALIGALISEIWFRDRRDGGLDVAAVTKPNLPCHGSPATVLTFIEPGVSSIGLPIVRCPASGAATPNLCGERVSKVRFAASE